MQKMLNLWIFPAALTAILLASCSPAPNGTGTAVEPNWNSLYTNIFGTITCRECHRAGGSSTSGLDFGSGSNIAYAALVNVNVTTPGSTSCSGVKRVKPGSASQSYLMGTIFSDYNSNGFAGMPGCQPVTTHYSTHNVVLSSAEKQAIIDWITAGASQ